MAREFHAASDTKEIGARVKQIRRLLGMTRPEFGKFLAMSDSMITQTENGSRKLTYNELLKLSYASGYSIHWILTGVQEYRETAEYQIDIIHAYENRQTSPIQEIMDAELLACEKQKKFVSSLPDSRQ